jgi:hypothetical protein
MRSAEYCEKQKKLRPRPMQNGGWAVDENQPGVSVTRARSTGAMPASQCPWRDHSGVVPTSKPIWPLPLLRDAASRRLKPTLHSHSPFASLLLP